MSKFICLQSGHEGVITGSVGAPGEQAFNIITRNRLSQILISKGFMVQLVNANPTDAEIKKDFDLFLAIHADANIYGTGGGMVDYPDPSVDYSNAESKRIKEAIESEYFHHSEIVNHPERSNANTKFYYMWSRLTSKTPCCLIECGVMQDAHDKVLLADTERIASALARGICVAFNVAYDIPPVQPPQPPPPEPPPIQPPVIEPPPPPVCDCSEHINKLKAIYNIVWGRGWWWTRVNQIRLLLPQ